MTPKAQSGSAAHWGPLWGAHPNDWARIEEQEIPTYEQGLHRAGIKPGQRVLDVGCGTGVFLSLAAQRGAQVYGLDASPSLLAVARERVPGADLRVGDMEFLPYEDDSFDVVTGFNSFFYAADMVRALREAGRVAKPGSPVLIQVWGRPEQCALDSLKRALAQFLPPPKSTPPKLWEPGILEGLAGAAGLTPADRFQTSWAFEFPDTESLLQHNMAPGIVVQATNVAGEEAVRAAITDALAPYRSADGSYRLTNEWLYLIARAR